MKSNLGEERTEQFTVTTMVNGNVIAERKIHDPFAHTTVTIRGWGHAWRAIFGGIKVGVSIDGSHGAQRAIMTLDPNDLHEDSVRHLADMAESRSRNKDEGILGCYAVN